MFWDAFVALCVSRGESPNAVAWQLSISSGTVTFWKNGSQPRATQLRKVADYFGVPVSYFSEGCPAKEAEDAGGLRFALYGEAPQDERIILAALEEVKKVGRPASDGPGDRGNEDRKS